MIGTALAVGGFIVSALGLGISGFFLGRSFGHYERDKDSEEKAASEPESLEMILSGHPERVLLRMKRDLERLGSEQRLAVLVKVRLDQGWTEVSRPSRYFNVGWLHGDAEDIYDALCDHFMDDDSVLVKSGSSQRQNEDSHPLIHRHKANRGRSRVMWADSDSPIILTLTVMGIPPLQLPETEQEREQELEKPELDPELLRAVQEVEGLAREVDDSLNRKAAARLRREVV